ncbi:NAD(P)/FAD-dependent oxidoreductase [Desertifilum sp. FACHB-1129]|uniref:Flavoprotein n=1 Tax=Desertifilum tharense IPPAS B-1220 TaxID=1781255 RepID=A0A1E5QNV0_9CYAN|nr:MULTISPECIES: NAD(P)/FAD-dependent oxidoreductase [Desertifilum]MDA0209354.1 NAD(P)/FAD-dependent oxidoreductase [Cyanobacteria bacterium FC1]MBD2311628.1 NAD(P)/FAD-dependent oxidoreductase [Desertifilum sp. FACHB-1129]MBD2322847.1 NAD(P)/FAD-dependent oxidoreductase [Desertifilum sp. FACHB-866]MBD2332759.1 NAD(P)/FAD-dependent oxidoreductase [Desertifilum sp. FACHB-868]OEJ76318.1 flavoprotein [Desertifilum tharense IPPAS B-1220]
MSQVIVIGGGAAGFFGAIAIAQADPLSRVILLEAGNQLLAKVRISGGGRCNVTHACFDPAVLVQNYPRGGKALRGPFSRFQPRDTVKWFEDRGVKLKTEEDGRMFPVTDRSETIVECLIEEAIAAGVDIRTGISVQGIQHKLVDDKPRFEVRLKSGQIILGDRILLATGSNPLGYQIARSLGHTIIPPVPSLFTFNITDPRLQDLSGVAVNNARVRLNDAKLEQTGPVLITHWGLSGPAVLKLSAWGARFLHEARYQTKLQIHWLPQYSQDTLRQMLGQVKNQIPQKQISANCPVPIPRRLWQSLTANLGIDQSDRWAGLSNKLLNQLIQELTQGEYEIQGKGIFKEEFVTCGGVSLKEVNFKTMESRCCPGLFFAGEILDIDGVTGGFNFQSAWTTAWLGAQP